MSAGILIVYAGK